MSWKSQKTTVPHSTNSPDDRATANQADNSTTDKPPPVAPKRSGNKVVPADLDSDSADLPADLADPQAGDRSAQSRVQTLERALDDALLCVEELRQQLKEQHFLENQLANTEEYSDVQQRAIAKLKAQISDLQTSLASEAIETQQRDQAIQELLTLIETLTQDQPETLELIRSQIVKEQHSAKSFHIEQLETQIATLQASLEAQHQHATDLESENFAIRNLTMSLRGQLELAQAQLLETRNAERGTRQPISLASPQPPTQPSFPTRELTQARQQIQQLEEHLTQEALQVTRWQQIHHEVEQERDRLLQRTSEQEQQTAELQEQILHQAQQVAEQETATQFWKDRQQSMRSQLIHLRDRLEQALNHAPQSIAPPPNSPLNAFLTDLLHQINQAIATDKSDNLPHPKPGSLRLPDFLVRRKDDG
jgi:hypothetical protein